MRNKLNALVLIAAPILAMMILFSLTTAIFGQITTTPGTIATLTAHQIPILSTQSATQSVPILVAGKKTVKLQIMSQHIGSTTPDLHNVAISNSTIWLEGKPGTNRTAVTYATMPVKNITGTVVATGILPDYGIYSYDVEGLAYVRVAWSGNSGNQVVVVGVQ